MNISSDWLPTAANINALPEPLRRYIHDLETRTDPAGEVRRIAELKDQVEALQVQLKTARAPRTDCFECGSDLLGPVCPRCNPNYFAGCLADDGESPKHAPKTLRDEFAVAALAALAAADAMMEARKQ